MKNNIKKKVTRTPKVLSKKEQYTKAYRKLKLAVDEMSECEDFFEDPEIISEIVHHFENMPDPKHLKEGLLFKEDPIDPCLCFDCIGIPMGPCH